MQKIKTTIAIVIVIIAVYLGQNKILAIWRQFTREPDIGLLALFIFLLIFLGVVRVLRD